MEPAKVYTASVDCLKDPALYQKTLDLLPAQRRESAERMKVESGKRLSAGAGLLLMSALAETLSGQEPVEDLPAGKGSAVSSESSAAVGEGSTKADKGLATVGEGSAAVEKEPVGSISGTCRSELREAIKTDLFQGYRQPAALRSLRFAQGEHGKPYLCDYPQVHFNLSHSGSRVMCVVAPYACGCDVEEVDHRRRQIELVIRCLAESEQRLAAVSTVHFYRIWTLKESILKLSGKGILVPLNSFEVTLDPPVVRQDFLPKPVLLKEYDTFWDDYCCSVALADGAAPERMTEIDLEQVLTAQEC